MATREYQDLIDHLLAYRRKEITLADLELREKLLLSTFNPWQQKNYFLLRGNYIHTPEVMTDVKKDNDCGCGCKGGLSCYENWLYIGGAGLVLLLLLRSRR